MKGQIRTPAPRDRAVHARHTHAEHGYTEVYTPYRVSSACAERRHQPRQVRGRPVSRSRDRDLYPSRHSEYSVHAISCATRSMPLKEAAAEVRSATRRVFARRPAPPAKDTRGMIRNHQFDKVELGRSSIPRNRTSARAADRTCRDDPEKNPSCRTAWSRYAPVNRLLVGQDLRIEVWLPGNNDYREISSARTRAFQARRMQARFRNEKGKPELVTTLNGSGLAVGRTLIAVMEKLSPRRRGVMFHRFCSPNGESQGHRAAAFSAW